jgi:hypothetical protein
MTYDTYLEPRVLVLAQAQPAPIPAAEDIQLV